MTHHTVTAVPPSSSALDTRDAFRRREARAIRALYRDYGRLVYAITHRVLKHRELAEEATQQTFVRAWQAADQFDADRNLGPWLATIARHAAIDVVRRETRHNTAALDALDEADRAIVARPPDPETLDAMWRVRAAIDELPAEEAAVVRCQHLDGLTHAEIAERLSIPLGTVKSRSRRAHRHLVALLGDLR
jgi:RNA polymerase sigma factor (sigma-70 family)